jgi:hypothetical protein
MTRARQSSGEPVSRGGPGTTSSSSSPEHELERVRAALREAEQTAAKAAAKVEQVEAETRETMGEVVSNLGTGVTPEEYDRALRGSQARREGAETAADRAEQYVSATGSCSTATSWTRGSTATGRAQRDIWR